MTWTWERRHQSCKARHYNGLSLARRDSRIRFRRRRYAARNPHTTNLAGTVATLQRCGHPGGCFTTGALNAAAQIGRTRQRQPCNVKRRLLAGAVIGTAMGMVAVNMAAAANDGTASGTATLSAGVYGAALGAVIGLGTCR